MSETVYQKIRDSLYQRGLFEKEADEILARLKADPAQAPMARRWNDPAADYPVALLATVMLAANAEAVKWIDENFPKHWARPLFEIATS